MKPKAIETLKDDTSVLFNVQTTYPDADKPENENLFSSYYAWAYVHKDTPKQFMTKTHPEIFEGKNRDDGLYFLRYEDAKRCADFIAEFGRMSGGWADNADWRLRRRGKVKTRIVMISKRETQHLVV